MKEYKVKKLFNTLLYSQGRPSQWHILNTRTPYFFEGIAVSRYSLEKIIQVLKILDVPNVRLETKKDFLHITPIGKYEERIYKLKKLPNQGIKFS